MARIIDAAEDLNHHPDIDIRYSSVYLALMTHSVGALTELDVDLANAISKIAAELRPDLNKTTPSRALMHIRSSNPIRGGSERQPDRQATPSARAASATAAATAGATRRSSALGTIWSRRRSSATTDRMASAAAIFIPR